MDGWKAVDAAVEVARAEVVAMAPDPAVAAEGEAYVIRILATCLNDAFLGHLFTDSGLARALPTRGGPNPDYKMAYAPLDHARRYRLEGQLHDSERVGIGLYSFGPGGSANICDYAVFDRTSVDADGQFALDIAADAEGPRALTMIPDARVVMIRTLHRNAAGAPARLVLTGGPPVRDLTLAQGSANAALKQVAQSLLVSIRTFLEWSAVTSAAVNSFHPETPKMTQGVQGDPDTIYFLGSFNLRKAEWLQVTLPAGIPGYWSLHAYNFWCESLPGASIGDNNCRIEADGSIRIAVGPKAGDAPNWLDTLGRARGALIFRFIGAANVEVPISVLQTTVEHTNSP